MLLSVCLQSNFSEIKHSGLPGWYTRVLHMPLAMARPWKHSKTGIYWLRKRVSDDLVRLVGKQEEKRSLGTRDPIEATGDKN